MLLHWVSAVEGAVILLLAAMFFKYGGPGVKWYRLTPALRRHFSRIPKGSLGWPLLGETLSLQQSLMSSTPHTFVTDRRQRYGSDMFLTHLFGSPVLASTNAETNRLILTKESDFTTTLPKSIKDTIGENALLLIQGQRHRRLRRLTLTSCSHESSASHASTIQDLASSCLQSWKGRTVIVADEARKFSFSVSLRVVLGLSSSSQRGQYFRDKFMEVRKGIRSLPVNLPGTSYRKALQARKDLADILRVFIKERKGSQDAHFPDLLGKLIYPNDGGDDFSDEEIIDAIVSTMLAGFDSSANTLIFLVYYIGQHPGLYNDLKEEHEEILRAKETNKPLTMSDLKKMKLTQAAISETLRLANPVLSLHRKAVRDFEHDGNFVPAGSQVQVWLRTMHTDSKLYPQPYDFDVSRWQGKATPTNFFPFGVGPRLCVGVEIARLQLCLFIHALITTYSWEMAENDTPRFFPEPGMRKGLPIIVKDL